MTLRVQFALGAAVNFVERESDLGKECHFAPEDFAEKELEAGGKVEVRMPDERVPKKEDADQDGC